MELKLTAEEKEKYAPYDNFPEFAQGFEDYMSDNPWPIKRKDRGIKVNSAGGQAYNRGLECALRRRQREIMARQP
jgi:hypothetical protein